MGLRVQANLVSAHAQNDLRRGAERLGGSCRRLSAGLRICAGADATSERLRARVRSIENVQRDTDDGCSLVQTAEDSLDELRSILPSLHERAARPPVPASDRAVRSAESSRVVDIDAAIHTLLITDENLSTAESRIRDVVVACETARRTRDSILKQASVALLSQANALPRSAHRLLG